METQGLQPVIAHPERTQSVLERPSLARELAERGWLLQVNGSSLTARHGPQSEALAWGLVDDGLVALVGSDGHRGTRPATLDDAYAATVTRVGETQARSLFDGSAIGVNSDRRGNTARAGAKRPPLGVLLYGCRGHVSALADT